MARSLVAGVRWVDHEEKVGCPSFTDFLPGRES